MMDMMGPIRLQIPEGVDLTGKDYRSVKTDEERAYLLSLISDSPVVAFDTETWTDNLWRPDGGPFDPHTGFIAGMSFCVQPYHAWYLPITHVEDHLNASDEYVLELLNLLSTKRVIMHNVSFDSKWVRHHYGVEFGEVEDTMVMAHLINPNRRFIGLKALSEEILNEKMIPYDETVPFNQYEVESATLYAAGDADSTFRLAEKQRPKMSVFKFLFKVENELTKVVGKVENYGIPATPSFFREASEVVGKEIGVVAEELWLELDAEKHHGQFNLNYSKILNSPQKLATLLYDGLNLPVVERSPKTNRPSVSANALNQLKRDYPVVEKLLFYKELVKLKSSFLESLPGWINPKTGRIHCSFLQCHVPTGRFASKDPNMQQIPTHDVSHVRRAFRAPEGWKMIAFDYSQIEMRIFASEAKEPALRLAFEKGVDLHKQTTSIMLGLPVESITDVQRQIGKVLNFGLIYGMQAYGLAFRIGVTKEEAQELIDAYFRGMPRARMWIDQVVRSARKQNGIFTHFGRWRGLPEINSKNPKERSKGERGAVNSIIQGTAADVIKIAMVRADKAIKKYGDQVEMILTIHDDLTFLVHNDVDVKDFVDTVATAMEFPVEGYVPFKVDVKLGPTWGDLLKLCKSCYEGIGPDHACGAEIEDVPDDEPLSEEDLDEETVIIAPAPPLPESVSSVSVITTKIPPETVRLTARDGLTETDLSEMMNLFGPDQDCFVELVIDGKTLTFPPNLMISYTDKDRWEKLYGVLPAPEKAFAGVEFK